MQRVNFGRIAVGWVLMSLLITSCAYSQSTVTAPMPFFTPSAPATLRVVAIPTQTPFPPIPSSPSPIPTANARWSLWISPEVPGGLKDILRLPEEVEVAEQAEQATLRIDINGGTESGRSIVASTQWIYSLVAPFPTVQDTVTIDELRLAWSGSQDTPAGPQPLLMEASTLASLTALWGSPGENAAKVLPAGDLLTEAWKKPYSWAIIPFEELDARWKVIQVNGVTPLERDFDPESYPLTIDYVLSAPQNLLENAKVALSLESSLLPASNRDPDKLTVLVMTGVTALVRATAGKMETNGITYPARDIGDWLRNADITHISNEVSFWPECPPPDPNTASLVFCSDPKYIGLLDDVSADVIELTGNHLNDWGTDALLYSLDLYQAHHMKVYAGGVNLEAARQPLIVEDHGNRLGFIGCNPAGPPKDWATETDPGAAPCDLDWEATEIGTLRAEGILPIATFQYNESYDVHPGAWQQRDFRKVSEAGAVIVSGSQSHYPQAFEFTSDNLIHYGPGNLFFDQMDPIINGARIPGTRWEFIDRHIIYNGHYISTELLTAMLEDYARPRPMTPEERTALLTYVFEASGW
ncbi:MAG: CapA family protein [Chloroflexi bacterium]|nr:CapA family protein [Chloroflexota bacterium]